MGFIQKWDLCQYWKQHNVRMNSVLCQHHCASSSASYKQNVATVYQCFLSLMLWTHDLNMWCSHLSSPQVCLFQIFPDIDQCRYFLLWRSDLQYVSCVSTLCEVVLMVCWDEIVMQPTVSGQTHHKNHKMLAFVLSNDTITHFYLFCVLWALIGIEWVGLFGWSVITQKLIELNSFFLFNFIYIALLIFLQRSFTYIHHMVLQ